MTLVRAAARAVLEAVLVLAAVAAVFKAAVSGPGFAAVAWLAAMVTVIAAAVLGVHALQPKRPDYERIAELERDVYGHAFPEDS